MLAITLGAKFRIGILSQLPAAQPKAWQEGTGYLRKRKNLPDAWWGRFVEAVETERGPVRIQRNVRLGEARLYTKPLAKRALREHVDRANDYQPMAVKSETMGKSATPFEHSHARFLPNNGRNAIVRLE